MKNKPHMIQTTLSQKLIDMAADNQKICDVRVKMSCRTLDMLDGVKTPTRHELKEDRGEVTQKLFQVTVPSDHVTVISSMCFQYSSSQLSLSADTEST